MSPVPNEQREAFRMALEALEETGLLGFILVIGSWAEYLYQVAFPNKGFEMSLRTRDVDLFLENMRKPPEPAGLVEALKKRGYLLDIDRLTGAGRFYREDLLELQFLVRAMGAATELSYNVPALSVRAEGLRDLDIFSLDPVTVSWEGYSVRIPAPEAFVLQKLLILDERQRWKREKDVEAIRMVLAYLVKPSALAMRFGHLSKARKKRILANAGEWGIILPISEETTRP